MCVCISQDFDLIRFFALSVDLSNARCHSEYAAGSVTDGGDGVEADPAPDRHSPRNLPAASWKPLHLAKRVSGCHGEVSHGGGGVGAGGGRARFITSLISTRIQTDESQYWLRVAARTVQKR